MYNVQQTPTGSVRVGARSFLGGLTGGAGVWTALMIGRSPAMDSILIGGRGAEPGKGEVESTAAGGVDNMDCVGTEELRSDTGREPCLPRFMGRGGGMW